MKTVEKENKMRRKMFKSDGRKKGDGNKKKMKNENKKKHMMQ